MGKVFTMILIVLLTLTHCVKQINGESSACTIIGSAVHCDQLKGKFLPKDNDGEIGSLFITNSDMRDLTSDDFSSYENVNKVLITNSEFGADFNILQDLQGLRNLKITNCSLGDSVAALFSHNAMLEKLSLRGNNITRVTKSLVAHLQHLVDLDLSDNDISFVEDGVFDHLPHLQELNLEGNALQEKAPDVVARTSDRCSICRTATQEHDEETEEGGLHAGPRPCSRSEATRCAADRWLDRLWWRAPVLTLRLRGNPLCNATWEGELSVQTSVKEGWEEGGDVVCEVEGAKCGLHDRRRLWLLEACGVEEADAKVEALGSSQGELLTAGGIIFLYGAFSGIILCGLVIGGIVVAYIWKRKNITSSGDHDPKSGRLQDIEMRLIRRSDEESNKRKQLIEAMRTGDHSTIARELNGKSSFYKTPDENGETLLHHAARSGEKFIDYLLNEGFSPNEENKTGLTPLHVALLEGNQMAAERMIKRQEDFKLSDVQDHTPLHIAASKGYLNVVRVLLKKNVQVNPETKERKTPLFIAAQEGHLEIVSLLIWNGANVNAKTDRGLMAIHVAAWNGHLQIVSTLASKMEDVNVTDNYGWTPLHCASRKGHYDVVKVLLQSKADPNARANSTNTPLHKAAKSGVIQTLRELLARGAQLELRNSAGKTAMDIAEEKGHAECARYLREQMAAVANQQNVG